MMRVVAGRLAIAMILAALVACEGSDDVAGPGTGSVVVAPVTGATTGPVSTSRPETSRPEASSSGTTAAPGPTAGPAPDGASTSSTTTSVAALDTTTATIAPSTTVPPTTQFLEGATPYVVPSPDPGSSWGRTHAGYPATDIFVPSGCGGDVVSPVDGDVLEVRRVDGWDPAADNPARRGGRSIAVLGDDGVRYYLAHFADIEPALATGGRVGAGERLGSVGTSGRSSACHIHFGISPPCPDAEWSVRRGVIWPYPYLDAWRRGEQRSPVDEVSSWVTDHPDACALAALDPYAGDAS